MGTRNPTITTAPLPIDSARQAPPVVGRSRVAARRAGDRFRALWSNLQPQDAAASRVRRPWWLWPHLLSLDAPLVALAWQDWWMQAEGTRATIPQRAILGLGVWMIYLADRLADNLQEPAARDTTARHAFVARWRGPVLVVVPLIGACLVVLAPCTLGAGQFRGGLAFLAGVGTYFWLIHRRGSRRWKAQVPKEALVGGMFALGTAFFACCHRALPPAPLMIAVALCGLVCFLNCALITAWERNLRDRRDPSSFLNAFPRLAAGGLRPVCWWLGGISAAAGIAMHTAIFFPVAMSALALAMLDRWQSHLAPETSRSLVDAVLLTPCLCSAILAALA